GSEGDVVLDDDPEVEAGGVTSMETDLAGGGDDAASVSPGVEANGESDMVGAFEDGRGGVEDSGSTDGSITGVAEGGEDDSALSIGDDEAWVVPTADDDAGAEEGETRPHRSWLPWRRHRPADVDEDPLTNLAPAGDAAALAGPDLPEDVIDMGDDDDASLEQAVSTPPSLPESELLAPESITSGDGEGSPDGTDAPDDGGGGGTSATGVEEEVAAQLGERGASNVADPPGQDGILPEGIPHMEEGSGEGGETQNDEGVGAGDVATTTDEDGFADVGSEGDVVLGDDPAGGAGGVTSMENGLARGGDDASSVSPAVETNDDGPAISGSDDDTAISTAEVGDLPDKHDATADSGSNDDTIGVFSAVSTGDDEASGVQTADGDAGVDEGETRPRRSWLPWRRHQPADVDEDPVTSLAPAGDGTALAGSDLPDDVVDVGDDDDASVEQAVQSLPESELLPPESIMSGRGEDLPDGTDGADAPDDGGGGGSVDGDAVPTGEPGEVSDDTDGGDETQNDEGVGAGDVATTTDEDGFADVGSEGAVVLGDDPAGGAGGVMSMGAGLARGDDDASSVSPAVETNDDRHSSAGDESTTGAGALADEHDATADAGSNDGAVGVSVTDGEASAVSTGDDEASGALTTDGDAGADEGETRPRRSWLPWRRDQPAEVDEDPLTGLAPAGDAAALAGPDLQEDVVDMGDDEDAAESAPLRSPEKVFLASESITSGRGEDIPDGTDAPDESGGGGGGVDGNAVPTGEAGDVSDGDGSIGNGMDDFGEGSSVEAEAVEAAAARLGEAGTSDPPGQDGALSEESSHIEEGIDRGDETQGDEGVEAGDVATTSDEDGVAHVGDEGDVVLGDGAEGGAGSVTSMGDGLAGGGDDASSVSPAVETNADGPSSAGGVSTAGVGTLVDGRDDATDSSSADGAIAAAAGDSEASAVSTGDDEALGVSSTDGDAGVDEGETRPRRSWLPWRRDQPAGVDEDPVKTLAPAGDDTALAGSDPPDDVVDVGDDLTAAALEQVVSTPSSLPESELLASESAMNSGDDVSTGEAGDVSDGADRDAGDAVAGDLGLGPHVNLEGGGRTSDLADPPGQDGTLSEESSHMEEGLADNAIVSGTAGDGEASALSIGGDEASDASSTDGDAGVDEGETRPRRSWLPWRRHQPADVDEDPATNLAPAGDDTALAGWDLPEDVVDVGDDLTTAALEQAVLSLSESVLLASESITDGGDDISTGEAGDVSDGDGPDAVTGDTGPGFHVNMEEGGTSDMADLPEQDTVLPEESSRTEEESAGGDGAWGGADAQDGDLATITDDVFADVSDEGDVVLGDGPEGGAGVVSSMGDGLAGGDEDASSVSPAVETGANDPATSGGVSTAEVGTLPGGDDVMDDSGSADGAVGAEGGESSAVSTGEHEASGVSSKDVGAGADEGNTRPRRSWLPWRRHRPADVDEDPATNLAPAEEDDADLAGPDLPEDVVDVGDDDDAALEQTESTPSSWPESALLGSESATNDESSHDGTDAPDRGGGVKAGGSELDGDAAAEYADGDAVPLAETGDVSDRDGPDAVAGDIGPGGGYETGPDGFGESSSVETAAAHLGEAGTSDMADPQEQVGALSEESHHMEEGYVGRDETDSVGDDQDGGVAMIPDEEGYADDGSEGDPVFGDDPEGGTGGVTSIGAGLTGGSNDVSSVSTAVETKADDSSTSGSDGISALPIDAEAGALTDGRDDAADSGLAGDAIIAGAAGDGEASAFSIGDDEASSVSSTDGDAGVDEGETRPRRSWLPWRRHQPADVDEDPVTNLAPAGDDTALAGSDLPEDVVDVGEDDEAALEQAVLSLSKSVLLASESITDGGEDISTGEAGDVSDGDDSEPVTGDNGPDPHVNLEVGGTGDMPDLPGPDGALSDESVNIEEGSDGGDRTQSDEAVEAGDVATTIDEDVFDDGSEGDAVLGDDPDGRASGVTSIGVGLTGDGDDAFTVSQTVETNADGRATSGSDSDSAITTAEVCALRGGYYATGDSGSNVGDMCILATDGDASAVSTGDREALGVSSKDGDAGADDGETRPRRSWLPWRRHRPADVDEDPVANLAPAGDDAGLAGSDLPDDLVDVGEDDEAALEQAVLSLSESVLLASESIADGGEDISTGGAGDVSDGDDREAVAGDLAPNLHVDLEDGGTGDMADPPGQDGALSEAGSHTEEGSVGDAHTRSGEDAKVGDETTTTDEDHLADDGGEGDAVLGDDPEGGAGGVTSLGDGLSGGDDDASSVSPVGEASDDDSSTSGSERDLAVSIDAEVGALMDGQDAAADSGAADGAVGAEGGESSAVSTGDREALGVSSKDGDAGADEGETRPRRSWLPWRRHRQADVDEDPVTNLVPAVDDTALADDLDLPEYMVDVGDDDDTALEQAVLSLSESVLLGSESITNGGEDISTGDAGDVSDGDNREAVIGDISPDPGGSDGGGDDVGDGLDDVGESTSVETFTASSEEGARDATDPPEPDGEIPDESSHEEEGPGAGHGAGNGEDAKAGDVATTADESGFADVGSEGDVVLGDDPEGGLAVVMSIGAGLTGGDDDASGVSADVATKADDAATSGGYGDSAVSAAEVGDLPDGHDAIGDSDSNGDPIGVSATGGESSAVSTGGDEASGVQTADGDAGVDEGETRPRRSWLPWHRHRPADVDEDPVTNVAPTGDGTALAGSDLPDDVVDVGDDLTAAALEQAVLSLSESELLASESITDGGEDISAGEAGDVSDGDDRDAVTGDIGPDPHVNLEDGGTSDMAESRGKDVNLSEESSHVEEVSGGGHDTQSDEDVEARDVATTTDEDVFADDGSEADVVLGDDPEGGAGGVTSMEAGEAGGDNDASGVSPVFETKVDDPATSGGGGDAAAVSTAEGGTLVGGRDDAADSGLADGAIIAGAAAGGESSAVSTGGDEASDVSSKDGDAGAPADETRPRRSWFPWRRHQPADVDEDPVTNLAPAGDDTDLADPDLPGDVVNVGDDLTAAALEQAVLSLSESVLLTSESITNGGEDVSTGETGDADDGDAQDVVPDSRGSDGTDSIGDDLDDLGEDDFGESASVEAATAHLEEGDGSDMTDPPGQDGELPEESYHVEEGPGAGHVPGSDEDAKAGDMTAVTDDSVVADVGGEGDVVLGDDPEGFSDDAGVDDDDDAPVVPVGGIHDASVVPHGDEHAAAEDPPTVQSPGETEAAARRRSRSPTKLAPDDVAHAAAVPQAAAAAAATAAATAGDDALELAATAVPVALAGGDGAAAGSA
ncbi:unnamed protein product, partial [Ectocarpus sp. 8 AP-2014]